MTGTNIDDRFKLYSVSDLFSLPEPEWLIDGLFSEGAFGCVFGPPGHGKSFVTLAWALSIASGVHWCGHEVQQGQVVYIAAEGGVGIRRRVAAWLQNNQLTDVPDAFFLLEGVQVHDSEEVEAVIDKLAECDKMPSVVIVDTLARCFAGGDENSAKEVGDFIAGIDRLRAETGAAVLVVHHTGKADNETERGSSALRAAADVMIRVARDASGAVVVRNNKQKDAEEFSPVRLRLQQVQLPGDDNITSCVLVPAAEVARQPDLRKHLRPTLRALASFPNGVATTAEWQQKTGAARTFYQHCRELEGDDFVRKVRRGHYAITEKGRAAVGGGTSTTDTGETLH